MGWRRMTADELAAGARKLVAHSKGLLAIDESNSTCDRRFAALGIPQTAEMRRNWRELLVTTPQLCRSISGIILYDETIRQKTSTGTSFATVLEESGIMPGIKVDIGTSNLAKHPGEKVTEGLDGLGGRLSAYAEMGARFAKWRAVFAIGETIPSRACIEVNAQALARYAALCQQAGLVPIVEPEVLMAGSHDLGRCSEVTEAVLRAVFYHLAEQGVALESVILKPNMVLAGADCPVQAGLDDVANATLAVLLRTVPAAVPGIAFLSGGQPAALATARLNAVNLNIGNINFGGPLPWPLAFSFARAIQQPALEIWRGRQDQWHAAQKMLAHRAQCDQAARTGSYYPLMEGEDAADGCSSELVH
jgi:fructose-bisphosphate aldolase class I